MRPFKISASITVRDSESVSKYLNEISKIPMVTAEEEVNLAILVRQGNHAARQRLINANLRFVVSVAKQFQHQGVSLSDLINEGNMGLMKAVERFDPRKGAKLSTYASWWIKQSIRRALANQSKTIRLPVHVVDKLFHMRRAATKLQEELGREATDEELAEAIRDSFTQMNEIAYREMVKLATEAALETYDRVVSSIVKRSRVRLRN